MKRIILFCLIASLAIFTLPGCSEKTAGSDENLSASSVPAVSETDDAPTAEQDAVYGYDANDGGAPASSAANPEDSEVPEQKETTDEESKSACHCSLAITCASILDNIDNFDQSKLEVLPKSGIILSVTETAFTQGETVFDILLRMTREAKIHMESVTSPIYGSSYIEGIGNIYEFDCGELSGWMYKVNGSFPSVGCSNYIPKDGDSIEWIYTCDLGRDIGGDWNLQNSDE